MKRASSLMNGRLKDVSPIVGEDESRHEHCRRHNALSFSGLVQTTLARLAALLIIVPNVPKTTALKMGFSNVEASPA
jgi:hypothetical protein